MKPKDGDLKIGAAERVLEKAKQENEAAKVCLSEAEQALAEAQ